MAEKQVVVSHGISTDSVDKAFNLLETSGAGFEEVPFVENAECIHNGKRLKHFASFSYLGRSYLPEAIEALCKGARESGLDARIAGFMQTNEKVTELRKLLEQISGGKVFISTSTSMATASFMFSCVGKNDAIVIERGKSHGTIILFSSIPHVPVAYVSVSDDTANALATIRDLAEKHDTVWYCTDSLDSSWGRALPKRVYDDVLVCAPNVKLYVEDAHGSFTVGKNGKGLFLRENELTSRTVVVCSMTKAFAGDGGFLVFGDPILYEHVRHCAMPTYFMAGIKPPMLHADVALAQHCFSEDFAKRQERLRQYSIYVHERFIMAGLPLTSSEDLPLKFVHVGRFDVACKFAQDLADRGFYVMPMPYPGIPRGHSGLRICLNAGHTWYEIRAFVKATIEVCPKDLQPPNVRIHDPFYEEVVNSEQIKKD